MPNNTLIIQTQAMPASLEALEARFGMSEEQVAAWCSDRTFERMLADNNPASGDVRQLNDGMAADGASGDRARAHGIGLGGRLALLGGGGFGLFMVAEAAIPGATEVAFADRICTIWSKEPAIDENCIRWIEINPDNPPSGGGDNPTWEVIVAADCEAIANRDDYAKDLDDLINRDSSGNVIDGSGRLVTYVRECDILFVGEYDATIGRRWTKVEFVMADPLNEITANDGQKAWLQVTISSLVSADMSANPSLYPVPTTTTEAATTTTTEAATTTSSTIEPSATTSTIKGAAEIVPTTVANRKDDSEKSSLDLLYAAGAVIGTGILAFGGLKLVKSRRQHALDVKIKPYEVSPVTTRAIDRGKGKMPGAATTRSAFDHKRR